MAISILEKNEGKKSRDPVPLSTTLRKTTKTSANAQQKCMNYKTHCCFANLT